MNIHQVRIFYIAAQTLSITKTAKKLHLSQPSVSIQIKDLEDSLNIRLFDRISRKISLTDAGQVFYEYSGRIISLIEETKAVMSEFGTGDKGKIIIGAPNTIGIYILPRFLGKFKELFPKAEISLHSLNRQEATDQVLSGEIDFAFVQMIPKHPDLKSEFFMKDELVIICSNKHKWAKLPYLTIEKIKEEPVEVIAREEGSGTRDIIDYMSRKYNIEVKIAMELTSTEAIKASVEANLGVAILSRSVVNREVREGSLSALTVKGLDAHREFFIVYNKKRKFMSMMKKFYDFMLETRSEIEV
jgi:DNA-binding transcriptional LysR family regulator